MKKQEKILFILLCIVYLVGIVGFQINSLVDDLLKLVFVNLLLFTAVLIYGHKPYTTKFLLWAFLVYFIGFGIEWLGVKTGVIFGKYEYTDVLGPAFAEVPLIIGINWFILMYCSIVITQKFIGTKTWHLMLIPAAIMTISDMLIEQVAIKYQFWIWENDTVPVKNYLGWFVTAFVMGLLFHLLKVKIENRLAIPLYILLMCFFALVLI